MTTTLVPVDVEALLVAALPGPVSTKVPNPRPSSFTRVSRAGGDRLDVAQSRVRMLVECWAPKSEVAFARAAEAWGAVALLARTTTAGVWVSRVELTEPTNLPDPESSTPRYQFVAQLTIPLRRVEVP